jgi:hypothetical protein
MGYWIKGMVEGLADVKVGIDRRGKIKKKHAVKRGFNLDVFDDRSYCEDVAFEIVEAFVREKNILWPDPEQGYGDVEFHAELKGDHVHWSIQGSAMLRVDFRMKDYEEKYLMWDRAVHWEADADPVEFFRKYAVRLHDDFEYRCPSEVDTLFRFYTIQSFEPVSMKFTGVGEDGEKVEDNQ